MLSSGGAVTQARELYALPYLDFVTISVLLLAINLCLS